jgi:hypothetical protein
MLSSHQAKRVMDVLGVDCCSATAASRTLDDESYADNWLIQNQSVILPSAILGCLFGFSLEGVCSSWVSSATSHANGHWCGLSWNYAQTAAVARNSEGR